MAGGTLVELICSFDDIFSFSHPSIKKTDKTISNLRLWAVKTAKNATKHVIEKAVKF